MPATWGRVQSGSGERLGELAAGGDAQRGEHLPQVVGDRGGADVQLRGNIGIGGTTAGQAGDMCFACGQSISGLRGAFGCALASRAELGPGPFGKPPAPAETKISYLARS